MSAPKTRTRPGPRTRQSTPATRLLTLFVGLVGVVALLALVIRLVTPGDGKADQEAAAAPTATVIPTAGPTPTPAIPAVDVTSWELRLIDRDHPLGEDFVPPSLEDVGDGQQMDSRVATAIKRLISDARAAGYGVYVCSGYRDYATQHVIYFDNHVDVYMAQGMSEEEANAKAGLAVQYPGCSEHQSGLCVDILESPDQDMEPYIGGSGLMLWLEQNCANYGYVIRYPENKTGITGIEYEPWHLRYVGEDAARYMMEHGQCLEEFLAMYNTANAGGDNAPILPAAAATPEGVQ